MSTQELQTLAQQFADAFNKKNLSLVLDMLSEDVRVNRTKVRKVS